MRRPFPKRRRDTITRANVERVLLEDGTAPEGPKIKTAQDLADHFCGVIGAMRFAKHRHLARCWRFMQAPKAEALQP